MAEAVFTMAADYFDLDPLEKVRRLEVIQQFVRDQIDEINRLNNIGDTDADDKS